MTQQLRLSAVGTCADRPRSADQRFMAMLSKARVRAARQVRSPQGDAHGSAPMIIANLVPRTIATRSPKTKARILQGRRHAAPVTSGTPQHEQRRRCRDAPRTEPASQCNEHGRRQRRRSQCAERRHVGDAKYALRQPDAGESGAGGGD